MRRMQLTPDLFAAYSTAGLTAPAFEILPVPKANLMTCRHCVRAQLDLCPKTLKFFPERLKTTDRKLFRPEPLLLKNSAGEVFRAEFHCEEKPCFMTITSPSGLPVRRPAEKPASQPAETVRSERPARADRRGAKRPFEKRTGEKRTFAKRGAPRSGENARGPRRNGDGKSFGNPKGRKR